MKPGLFKRKGIWHIDKQIHGRRICQSTGTSELEKAESFLAKIIEEKRQAVIFGVRPKRTFEKAAAKYVLENQHKRSLQSDIHRIKYLLPWIGDLNLDEIHSGTLQPWIEYRRKQGRAANTINHGLKIVRHILNLSATEWIDENCLTWLLAAPKIKLLPVTDARKPYPLNWGEQDRLIKELPKHLALLAAKTCCKDRWRQVINEANRIEVKHLLTLQEGVSLNQFQEMEDEGIRLVVPKQIHRKYHKDIRGKLLGFDEFIKETKSLYR